MATAAIVRLSRVLDLEERQNYRNRAVIGGLQAMAGRWAEDARKEDVDAALVERAETVMALYAVAPPSDRPDLMRRLRRILEGDTDALEDAGMAVAEESAAQPSAETPMTAALAAELESVAARPSTPSPAEAVDDGRGDPLPESGPGATYVFEYTQPAAAPVSDARTARPSGRPARTVQDLRAAPTILQGVGPSVNEQLRKLGLLCVEDLLWHLPMRHEDYSQMRTIAEVRPGEQATISANLWDVRERSVGIKRTIVEGIFSDGTGTLTATWWNKWVKTNLKAGSLYRLSGKIGLYLGKKTIDNPAFEDADADAISTARIAPIYRLTEGLSQKKLRQVQRQVVDDFAHLLTDPLPQALLERYGLMDLATALRQYHFPDDAQQMAAARRRLTFAELFYVQMGVLQRRGELKASAAAPLPSTADQLAAFANAMPFALTGAQRRVLGEVAADLARSVPMTRLIQGDVGSGKTAVAAGAMWLGALSGKQSALLAPTQILAEQHHRGLSRLLAPLTRSDGSSLRIALLTGRVTGNEREGVLRDMADGAIDVVVGTTALIQDGVQFADLGLVVVDEQHRFGVEQRGALRSSTGLQPHMLVMSATPIPRSLALTIFGDLDLSLLDEMPPGRLPVKTVLFRPHERERVYGFVRTQAQEGRQSFIVYPLVEESESLEAGAATESYERLQKEVFPDLRLALLHGQMKGSEKDAVMQAFAAGEFDVLVSTSVIEVGIDVPNATVMIVEDAERFGLAQLHQFRGRVGRGDQRSFCVLVSRAEGDAAEERLRILQNSNDGFVLAEKDLELRGPGDFLGTRQSGLPELRIAAFSDLETLTLARDAALALFAEDATLANYPELARQVQRFWHGEGDIS